MTQAKLTRKQAKAQRDIFRSYLKALGNEDGSILWKNKDMDSFIEYVDMACQKKKQQDFPRDLTLPSLSHTAFTEETYYWLNILWALADRFVEDSMIQ